MSTINLEGFKAPGKANTKQGVAKGQDFKFRFKAGKFYIANDVFKQEDFENRAFKVLVHPETHAVVLLEVENDAADILKRNSKTGLTKQPFFKSSVIADALKRSGIVVDPTVNTYLDLVSGTTPDGKAVYAISAGEKRTTETAASLPVEEASETVSEAPKEEKPVEEPIAGAVESNLDASNGLGQAPGSDDLMGGLNLGSETTSAAQTDDQEGQSTKPEFNEEEF